MMRASQPPPPRLVVAASQNGARQSQVIEAKEVTLVFLDHARQLGFTVFRIVTTAESPGNQDQAAAMANSSPGSPSQPPPRTMPVFTIPLYVHHNNPTTGTAPVIRAIWNWCRDLLKSPTIGRCLNELGLSECSVRFEAYQTQATLRVRSPSYAHVHTIRRLTPASGHN